MHRVGRLRTRPVRRIDSSHGIPSSRPNHSRGRHGPPGPTGTARRSRRTTDASEPTIHCCWQALDRRQSASSLVKLLRDPLGYLWTYGFGWSEPTETDEPLTLDPLAFGNLLHEILEEAVTRLERARPGGLATATIDEIAHASMAAGDHVVARWDETRPIPPPVVWRRKHSEATELATVALSYREEPLVDQRSWAEVPFGGDRRTEALTEEARLALPWDPVTPVAIPGTDIRIGGSIDRLDLSGDPPPCTCHRLQVRHA